MSEQKTMAWRVERFTRARLDHLLKQMSPNVCRATLAQLRRGVGSKPGDLPELWGMLLQDMPEEMYGRGDRASRQEIAVYTALTLFAVHQQGRDPASAPMHREGCPFGSAVARLARGDEDARERIERRFSRAVTASDMAEFAHHLRGLVQLLSAEGIPLDWAQMAGQMFLWQSAERAAGVRLRWGEDFYRALGKNDDV